jgi:predicted nucleic acid-binding protein
VGYLFDTNHLIHLSNGVIQVVSRLDTVSDQEPVVTSILVVAELMYGAECSARREENMRIIE